ncbi:MAG TPA: hypothetical protein VHP33_26270 [Polyangiaceae bacterium]|nr:hypothetical protein [Polyangiaceae bacterium]
MKLALMALGAALALFEPSVAAALEGTPTAEPPAVGRMVEIRVSGDAAALARVRITARELLLRLDVQPNVKALEEPETPSTEPVPLVIAYVDLRNLAAPSIDIEDGQTRQGLTQRRLSDVTSLETGVEAVLHVLYLAVESRLQVGVERSSPAPAPPPKKPAPEPQPRAQPASSFGFDVGPLLRLSSLGDGRIVPGGGVGLEPRAGFGRAQAGLLVSATLHGTSELVFERGEVALRPVQVRVVPTFDWLFSRELAGCLGLGAGLDSLMVTPLEEPDAGKTTRAQSAIDPMLTALIGARVPVSRRVFLAAMASLDLDLAPTTFVARQGLESRSLMQLPRVRGGFTLALSFTAAGERRFSKAGFEQ